MMNTRSISINRKLFDKPLETGGTKQLEHWKIQLYLPPSDIPGFINSKYDSKNDNLFIDFDYSVSEPTVALAPGNEEIELKVGRESGKLVQILIKHLKKRNIGKVEIERLVKEDVSNIILNKFGGSKNIREKNNLFRGAEAIRESAHEISQFAGDALLVG